MLRSSVGAALLILALALAAGPAEAPYHTAPAQPAAAASALDAARAQAKVAASHAGYAAEAATVSGAKEHLGHALVCIEGPAGRHVRPYWENPCRGMGNGVLADLQRARANPSLLERARAADRTAVAAMGGTDLARIKASARQVSAAMVEIARSK